MVKIDMEAIRRLSVPDRVRLVQDIWDSIQPTAEQLPLTEEQAQIIDARLEEHRADPQAVIPWRDVKQQLESSK